jgi:hypothetical protein
MIEFLTAARHRVLLLQMGVLWLSAVAAGLSFFDSLHAFITTLCLITLGLLSLKAAFYAVNQCQQTKSCRSELAGMRSELTELSGQVTTMNSQLLELAELAGQVTTMNSQLLELAELSGQVTTMNSQLLELAESCARNEAADRDRAIVEKLPVQVAKIEQEVTWLLDNIETSGKALNL